MQSLSWAQRLAQLSTIIGTDVITDDEDHQGKTLDGYLSRRQTKQNRAQINKFRFTDDDLNVIGKLADGQFGTIDVVRCRLDSRVYIRKTIEKCTAVRARGVERKILTLALKSRSVWAPHLLCAFQTDSSLRLVMQYADGGSVWDLIESSPEGKVREADLRWWIPQMVSAIQWCHSQGFVHRDIKPHNFVLTPTSRILLIDFGSAAPLASPSSSGVQLIPREYCLVPCGTCDYISPEILMSHEAALVAIELEDNSDNSSQLSEESVNEEDGSRTYGRETDWWSLGAVIYEMAFGIAPFYANDIQTTYTKIMNYRASLKFRESADLSSNGVALLQRLLCDKELRLGRHSSSEITNHEFFHNVDWSNLHQCPVPSKLHLPQFIYSDTVIDPSKSRVMPAGFEQIDEHRTSDSCSKPFEFSALFQFSNSTSGLTFLQDTPVPKETSPNFGSSFIGFSWGPRVNAFGQDNFLSSTEQRSLYQEPITLTPRPGLSGNIVDGPEVFGTTPASQRFRTPIRPNLLQNQPVSVPQINGTALRSQSRRPFSDREAMQLLMHCVGMSARRRVLQSGKKPRYIPAGMTLVQHQNQRADPDPDPMPTKIRKDMSGSVASSETESQPPSPSPRPGSSLSRKSLGGQSSVSLLQGRSTPTFTTFGMPVNYSNTSSNSISVFDMKLTEAENCHENLVEDLSIIEQSLSTISMRLSQKH